MFKKRYFIVWPFLLGLIAMAWIISVTAALIPVVHEHQSPGGEIAFVVSGFILGFTAMIFGLRERMRREPGTKKHQNGAAGLSPDGDATNRLEK